LFGNYKNKRINSKKSHAQQTIEYNRKLMLLLQLFCGAYGGVSAHGAMQNTGHSVVITTLDNGVIRGITKALNMENLITWQI
jgi:hypothetical protein